MNTQALFLELLVSGFFAIACFKARAAVEPGEVALRPRDLFRLTDRLERLSRSRWQWVAMAGILVLIREQAGVPLAVELTAAAQFILFLSLPVATPAKTARITASLASPGRRSLVAGASRRRTTVNAGTR